MKQCPAGYLYCQRLYCSHWALVGWCHLSHASRAVDEEKDDLKLKVATLGRELADARKVILNSVLVVDKLNREVELLKEDASGWCVVCGKHIKRNWLKHLATHKDSFVGHVASNKLKNRKKK